MLCQFYFCWYSKDVFSFLHVYVLLHWCSVYLVSWSSKLKNTEVFVGAASGYGHGAAHAVFFGLSILAPSFGRATYYTDTCPQMPIFLVTGISFHLCECFCHTRFHSGITITQLIVWQRLVVLCPGGICVIKGCRLFYLPVFLCFSLYCCCGSFPWFLNFQQLLSLIFYFLLHVLDFSTSFYVRPHL